MVKKIDDEVNRMFDLLDPLISAGQEHDESKFKEYNRMYSFDHDRKMINGQGVVEEKIRLMDNVRQTVAMGFFMSGATGKLQNLDDHITKAREQYEEIRKIYFSSEK